MENFDHSTTLKKPCANKKDRKLDKGTTQAINGHDCCDSISAILNRSFHNSSASFF